MEEGCIRIPSFCPSRPCVWLVGGACAPGHRVVHGEFLLEFLDLALVAPTQHLHAQDGMHARTPVVTQRRSGYHPVIARRVAA